MTIAEFKSHFGIEKIDIIKSPTTEKLFWVGGTHRGPVQQTLDTTKPMSFSLLPTDTTTGQSAYCLVNTNTENVVASL